MVLHSYYSLYECIDTKRLKKALNALDREGKLEYEIDKPNFLLKIDDIDLEDDDIEYLVELLEELEVYPNLDKEEDDEDDEDDLGYDDDNDEYDDY
jgi:hypothetical protein